MCGLAGLFTTKATGADELTTTLDRMTCSLTHRGPDDQGTWVDPSNGVGLGFRRLAIIDLSEAGHQPMTSHSGRYVIVFNGEVFNHRQIRTDLAGVPFRGHSDTEVITAAFDRWGIERSVERFVGMFAIAAWDRVERRVWLIRDRLGIKPMYYAVGDGFVSFGSELKALRAGPAFDRSLDPDALAAYLRYLYVPAPMSIYRSVRKLLPGHVMTIGADGLSAPSAFWSLADAQRRGQERPFDGSDVEAVDELHDRLLEAVQLRLEADVPLGALLSGGVDSTAVVALMRQASTSPTRTYSIGFPDTEHDESRHAARIAVHLGTKHTAMVVEPSDALAQVPQLPDVFDEPFADPSLIPTLVVSRLARRDVTVALTGDGGDELFAGYNRYRHGAPMIQGLARIPFALRTLAATGLGGVSARSWERGFQAIRTALPTSAQHRLAGEKLAKIAAMLPHRSEADMYQSLVSAWQRPETLLATTDRFGFDPMAEQLRRNQALPLLDRIMLADQAVYLPDDLLAKVDRASMAASLEARVPLLDHRVVEFSWTLPRSYLIRGNVGKWVLRQVVRRYVPDVLMDRPKVGFTVPLSAWLRGPLRSWARETLLASGVGTSGVGERVLRPEVVQNLWRQFEAGHEQIALGVWTVLMLEAWRQRWA